jgi:hypothetical protein
MESKKQKKLTEVHKTQFTPNYDSENYAEAYKLLIKYPDLKDYLTNSQARGMVGYLLDKNISDIKTMKSSLEKTLNKLENIDKIK